MSPKRDRKEDLMIHKKEGNVVKMKVEIRVMWTQAKECWQPLEVERVKERILPQSF